MAPFQWFLTIFGGMGVLMAALYYFAQSAFEADDRRLTVTQTAIFGFGAFALACVAATLWMAGGNSFICVALGAAALGVLRMTRNSLKAALDGPARLSAGGDIRRDPHLRTRPRRFGKNILLVEPGRILVRLHYGLRDTMWPVIGGLAWLGMEYNDWARSRTRHNPLEFLQMPLAFMIGTIAGGYFKARRLRVLVEARQGTVYAGREPVCGLDSACVTVTPFTGGYNVYVRSGDAEDDRALLVTVPQQDMADAVASLVREFLADCNGEGIWPPSIIVR